eukprot:4508047-Alexandrium_andersonii.AAC.1
MGPAGMAALMQGTQALREPPSPAPTLPVPAPTLPVAGVGDAQDGGNRPAADGPVGAVPGRPILKAVAHPRPCIEATARLMLQE